MTWVIGILLFLAAVALFLKELLSKPEPGKVWPWRLAWIAALLGSLAFLIQIFLPKEEPLTKEDVRDSVEEALCNWEEFKKEINDLEEWSPEKKERLEQAANCLIKQAVSAFDSGLVCIGRQEYGEAIIHLQYALEAERNSDVLDSTRMAEVWFYTGDAHAYAESYELSLAGWDSVLAYKHDDHQAWNNRGVALSKLGRREEAIASFDSALAYECSSFVAWYNRGVSLGNLSRYEEEIASYDSALAYKHDYPKAWNNRGVALSKLGRREEAIASCDSALKYDPSLQNAVELRRAISEIAADSL
jgi:tetratricopeptide (TPR) repeat protein